MGISISYSGSLADPSSAPQFERELFVYKKVGNTAPVYVNRVETAMRTNSHHFVLYTFQDSTPPDIVPPYDAVRDIRRPDGTLDFNAMRPMGYHVFFGGAMTERGFFGAGAVASFCTALMISSRKT